MTGQRTVLACDVDGERWPAGRPHPYVRLCRTPREVGCTGCERCLPGSAGGEAAGAGTDGRVQVSSGVSPFEYQNVEQAVVPLGEIGERQRAGRASVEDEEDDGIASEVASVGGDGELHLTETRQVAYPR